MDAFKRIKYRLSAKGIVLDFLDTCHRKSDLEASQIAALLVDNESNSQLDALVQIALEELEAVQQRCRTPEGEPSQSERIQLLAIKTLMQVKGRRRLTEWLNSAD